MTDIIEHDFGKAERETRRAHGEKLANLLTRSEKLKAELRDDPTRLFDYAKKRIDELQRQTAGAQEALLVPTEPYPGRPGRVDMPTLTVCAREYERLKKCADLVRAMEII